MRGINGKVLSKSGEKPLAGIPISDGRNVVLTDPDGRFSLPGWERARMVFACVLTFGRSDWYLPLRPEQESYDFYLDPLKGADAFSFLHVSDTEIEDRPCAFIPFLQKTAAEQRPAFFFHTGDLCRESGVRRHYLALNSEVLGCPVRFAIGNHDFCAGDYGEALYESLYGPAWYSFDYGRIHFIVMSIGKGDHPSGYLPEDQWNWLENDLRAAKGKKLIMMNHTHCPDPGFMANTGRGTVDFPGLGLLAWCFGHYHIQMAHEYGGILKICGSMADSGGIDSSPSGIRKVSVRGDKLQTTVLYNQKKYRAEKPLWSRKLPGQIQFSALMAAGDDLILCTGDDGFPKNCGVFCLSGKDGSVLWNFPTENGIYNHAARAAGKIYVQDSKGTLYCLSEERGALLWKTRSPLSALGFTRSGVTAAEGKILAGGPDRISAYDPATGAPLWRTEPCGCQNTPARWIIDKERNRLIVGAHWLALRAYDLESGKLVWKQDCRGCWFRSSTPLLRDGRIYTFGLDRAVILNADTGAVITEKSIGCNMDVSAAPLWDEGVLYAASSDSGVLVLDPESLKILRRFPVGPAGLFTAPYQYGRLQTVECTPQIQGDTLIFAASDGGVYFYDKKTALLRRRIQLGAPSVTTPLLTSGGIVTADFQGTVRKYQTEAL